MGRKCPNCGADLERWPAGDEFTEEATWIVFRCTRCSYLLRVKHVD
ncbi:MAG: hypothetical protein QXH26_03565 [Candidatus Hadarchaeales archaeon]